MLSGKIDAEVSVYNNELVAWRIEHPELKLRHWTMSSLGFDTPGYAIITSDTRPGDAITAPGTALIRPAAASATVNVWAGDPATGKRRNLTAEEDRAFWAWATVEVLRSTGIRAEELVQLSHHSFVQYRLPGTGEDAQRARVGPGHGQQGKLNTLPDIRGREP